jgi:N-acetylglucosaminyldiphosphoundecaprenol N-acetyl-beta-D-mannosaminyltransferase
MSSMDERDTVRAVDSADAASAVKSVDAADAADAVKAADAADAVGAVKSVNAADAADAVGATSAMDAVNATDAAGAVKATDAADTVKAVPTVDLYGFAFSKMNMADTVAFLTGRIARREVTQVITGNPIMLMKALQDARHAEAMHGAELLVADGTGVVWAAARSGEPVRERVAGYDLMHELLRVGDTQGYRVYLLGSSQQVIELTVERLHKLYPGVVIAGYHNGYFGAAEDASVVRDIAQAQPDILFVARSVDTQEPWIYEHKSALAVPVMMGVGGSFDVVAGVVQRAPQLFQRLRLEWLFRLLKQPSRLPRMLDLPRFVWKVLTHPPGNQGKNR